MILYMTGFEEYANGRTAFPFDFWFDEIFYVTGGDMRIGSGRYGGHALTNNLGGGSEQYILPVTGALYDCVIGFAYKYIENHGGGYNTLLFSLQDRSNEYGGMLSIGLNRIQLRRLENGCLAITTGSYNTSGIFPVITSNKPLLPNRYYYVEVVLTFNSLWDPKLIYDWSYNQGSQAKIIIDGEVTADFNPSNLDYISGPSFDNLLATQTLPGTFGASAEIPVHYIFFHYDHFRTQSWYDDVYIISNVFVRPTANGLVSAGTGPHTPLGEMNVRTLLADQTRPSASGRDSWFQFGTAVNKAASINQIDPPIIFNNGIANTYISSGLNGSIQTFYYDAMKTNPETIFAIQPTLIGYAAPTTRQCDFYIGTSAGSGNYEAVGFDKLDISKSSLNFTSNFVILQQVFTQDPNSNSDWTYSVVNTLELGLKLIS